MDVVKAVEVIFRHVGRCKDPLAKVGRLLVTINTNCNNIIALIAINIASEYLQDVKRK